MLSRKYIIVPGLMLLVALHSMECEDSNALTEAQKLAALRNVQLIYDGMTYDISLPPGALGGQPLAELVLNDPETYNNPANYSIEIAVNVTADNTGTDAEDAKFDGMDIDIVLDTLESEPIKMSNAGFEVMKNEVYPITLETSINLETHRAAGLYIFHQTVDGNDLSTKLYPYLYYNLGLQGTIALPVLHKDIPTRASDEMKDFLRQLLDSGILDEQ